MGASGAMMAGGAGLSAYSAAQQQKSANMAYEYNARVQERQAQIADLQAEDAISRGRQDEKILRKDIANLKSNQRVGFASSGVVVDQGSAMDTIIDTQNQGDRDALTIRHNAAKEAWALRENANTMRSQGEMYRLQKRNPNTVFAQSLLMQGANKGGQYALAKGY